MSQTRKLQVELSNEERVEACLQTLRLCVQVIRDLIGEPETQNLPGPIAMTALANLFEEMIHDVILSITPEQGTS